MRRTFRRNPHFRNTLTLYGRHTVAEFMEKRPDLIVNIFVAESVDKDFFEAIRVFAKRNKLQFNSVSRKFIDRKVGEVNHQGVIVDIKEFPYADIDEVLDSFDKSRKRMILVMENINDPRNAGAIIRSAVAFGASAICIPKINQVGMTSAVAKVSAGAIFKVPICHIGNMTSTIKMLQAKRFWVASLDMRGENVREADLKDNFAIIVGSEGDGVRERTLENSDMILSVPISKEVESLNASVASAIAMYEWRVQNIE